MRAVAAAVVVVLASLAPAGPVAPAGGTVAADGSSSLGTGHPVAEPAPDAGSPIDDRIERSRAANRSSVARENERPLADAGLDQRATWGDPVYLDARGSRDPDGRIVAYEWRVETPNGSRVTPACGDCPRTSFRPNGTGRFAVTVTVTDDDGATASDTLYVNVSAGDPPGVRLAGPTDPRVGGPETYRVVTERGDPPVERVVLRRNGREVVNRSVAGAGTHRVRVRFPSAGSYDLNATAVDAAGQRANDTLTVTARDPAPDPGPGPEPGPDPGDPGTGNGTLTAAIDGPTEAGVGDRVTFDGSDSTAPNGSIESFDWTFGDGNATTGSSATHRYGSPGTYEVELTVSNGSANDTATHAITVRNDTGGCTGGCGSDPGSPGNDSSESGGEWSVSVSGPAEINASERAEYTAGLSGVDGSDVRTWEWRVVDGNGSLSGTDGYAAGESVRYTPGSGDDGTTVTVRATATLAADAPENPSESRNASASTAVGDANLAPTAAIRVNDSSPTVGQSVVLEADASDPDGSIAEYDWQLGDGTNGTGAALTHSYDTAGEYTVELTVTDDEGATDTATTTIGVTAGDGTDGNDTSSDGRTQAEVDLSTVVYDSGVFEVGSRLCATADSGPSDPDTGDYCAEDAYNPLGADGHQVNVTRYVVRSDALKSTIEETVGSTAYGPRTHVVGKSSVIEDGEAVGQQFDAEITYYFTVNGTESKRSATVTIDTCDGYGTLCGGTNTTGFRVDLESSSDAVEIGDSFTMTAAPAGGNHTISEYDYEWDRTVNGLTDSWTNPGNSGQLLDQDTADGAFPKPDEEGTTPPYDADYTVTVSEPPTLKNPREVTDDTIVRINGCSEGETWSDSLENCSTADDGGQDGKESDGNDPPTVNLEVTDNPDGAGTSVPVGSTVTVTADASDPDGDLSQSTDVYTWGVDGNEVSADRTLDVTFDETGRHTVNVTVKDEAGATAVDRLSITATESGEDCRFDCGNRGDPSGGDGGNSGGDGSEGGSGGGSGDECQARSPNGDYCLVG